MSDQRLRALENGLHLAWYEYDIGDRKIKVQGTWEKKFADFLIEQGIKFDRISVLFRGSHRYTPDFYIPSLNIYVEVKGWMCEKDKYKMLVVLEEHPHLDIRVLDKRNIKNIPLEIDTLPKFVDEHKISDVDFTKFIKRF